MRSCSSSPALVSSPPSTAHTSPAGREDMESNNGNGGDTVVDVALGLKLSQHPVLANSSQVPMTVHAAIDSSSHSSYGSDDNNQPASPPSAAANNSAKTTKSTTSTSNNASNSAEDSSHLHNGQLVQSPTRSSANVGGANHQNPVGEDNSQTLFANSNSNSNPSSNSQAGSNLSSSSNNTCSTDAEGDRDGENGKDEMLFAKKAISKTNSMTSALSSFSSVAIPHPSTHKHKHKHKHRHPKNAQDDETQTIVAAALNSDGGAANPDILGTSCDCSSPPQAQVNNKSRIQTPASRSLVTIGDEEIGVHQPFDSKTAETSPTNGATASDLGASPVELAGRLSDKYTVTRPNRYVPAVPVMPSEQLTRTTANNEEAKNVPELSDFALKSSQKLSKFPYLWAKQNQNDFSSAPSSFTNSTIRPATERSTPVSSGQVTPTISGREASETTLRENMGVHRTLSVDSVAQKLAQQRFAHTNDVSPPPKQVREPKTPLYVPAVLRRTAPSASASTSPYESVNPSPKKGRAGSEGAPPTRRHWRPDEERDSCYDCDKIFTFFDRRHHCRKCGEIFCAGDTQYTVFLDHELNFDTLGYPSRACRRCFSAYMKYKERLPIVNQKPQPSIPRVAGPVGVARPNDAFATPVPQAMVSGSVMKNSGNMDGVGSVPADWSWSTF